MTDREPAGERPNAPKREDTFRREPATAVLPDLTDLFDRRIDPQRRAEYDRRLLPQYAVPDSGTAQGNEVDAPPLPDPVSPTFRFDRGRRGFAAMVAKPIGRAIVMSSPLLLSGLVLIVVKVAISQFGANMLPVALLGLWGMQLFGVIYSRALGFSEWVVVWATLAVSVGIVVPLLALQAMLGAIPYVSMAQQSAGPFLAVSLAMLAVLLASVIGVAMLSRQQPERASIFLLPIAVIIPALLGVSGEGFGVSVLDPLAFALFGAGGWAALMWLAPRGLWLLATPVALIAQFCLLLLRGAGPLPGVNAGMVVSFGYGIVLVTLAVASVAVPLISRWIGSVTGDRTR